MFSEYPASFAGVAELSSQPGDAERAPDSRPTIPRWERAMSELLAWAQPLARVLGCCTPLNLQAELAALRDDFANGKPRAPRFAYGGPPRTDSRPSLERAARQLEQEGPLAQLYAARAHELALEASICHAAGTHRLEALAARRYARRDHWDDEAIGLSERWLVSDIDDDDDAPIVSDDDKDARSLLCRLQDEVGARRLAMRVVVAHRMSALAATGPGVIYVASGRRMTLRDVERTVLHEIEGHAMPRDRAALQSVGLFQLGTARGSDEQEGRALALEDRAGLLDGRRRMELARRHLAGRGVRGGASFVDTTRALLDAGTGLSDALRIAARAHRGGGLARELVYLPAYLRVSDALRRDPSIDHVLSRGQLALDSVETLRRWC